MPFEEEQEDRSAEQGFEQFQNDFNRGAIAFLALALLVTGEECTAHEKYREFLDPIVGNRNRNKTGFNTVMPDLYKKVIGYCQKAVEISKVHEKC